MLQQQPPDAQPRGIKVPEEVFGLWIQAVLSPMIFLLCILFHLELTISLFNVFWMILTTTLLDILWICAPALYATRFGNITEKPDSSFPTHLIRPSWRGSVSLCQFFKPSSEIFQRCYRLPRRKEQRLGQNEGKKQSVMNQIIDGPAGFQPGWA